MLFTEPLFLFAFLPVVVVVWLGLPRGRLWLLLAASLAFYSWGEPQFVPVVLASAALDYALGPAVARGSPWALRLGVVANLAVLVVYKYLGFLGGMAGLALPAIALPIGVSFVVFEKITYLADLSRGLVPPRRGFARYLAYVLFFPKLLAGPIIKFHEIAPQFAHPPSPSLDAFTAGFARFMLGVIKKILLADILAGGADTLFARPDAAIGFSEAWAGVLLFTLQIYLDFSAYSDMAIGLARIFGFPLRENFDQPYTAASITEFWRRWHISLTTWIRDYLYIPLGGNRAGRARQALNLWICFLASGLWHGAAWTYVAWGAFHGLFLALDKLFLLRWLGVLPRLLANGVTLLLVMVGWAIFRASSLRQAWHILAAMAHPGWRGAGFVWANDLALATLAGIAVCVAPLVLPLDRLGGRRAVQWGVQLAGLLLFAAALGRAVADPFRPFLYFRF